jgi:hypothetical protein
MVKRTLTREDKLYMLWKAMEEKHAKWRETETNSDEEKILYSEILDIQERFQNIERRLPKTSKMLKFIRKRERETS